jgi:hypothetical protein
MTKQNMTKRQTMFDKNYTENYIGRTEQAKHIEKFYHTRVESNTLTITQSMQFPYVRLSVISTLIKDDKTILNTERVEIQHSQLHVYAN